MIQALILASVPAEIGGAFALSGPHPVIAGALTVLAVFSVMFAGDRYAQTENPKR